jgi:hypothetical protein
MAGDRLRAGKHRPKATHVAPYIETRQADRRHWPTWWRATCSSERNPTANFGLQVGPEVGTALLFWPLLITIGCTSPADIQVASEWQGSSASGNGNRRGAAMLPGMYWNRALGATSRKTRGGQSGHGERYADFTSMKQPSNGWAASTGMDNHCGIGFNECLPEDGAHPVTCSACCGASPARFEWSLKTTWPHLHEVSART